MTVALVGTGGYRVGSMDRKLRPKRTMPDGTGANSLDGALYERPLRSSGRGGLTGSPRADTADAAPTSKQGDLCSANSQTESGAGMLGTHETVHEDSLNDDLRRRSRRRVRDGHHQKHTGVSPAERPQYSPARRTRATSAPISEG